MGMMSRQTRRSGLVMGFDNPHDRQEPCLLTSTQPTQPNITNETSPHFAEALTSEGASLWDSFRR